MLARVLRLGALFVVSLSLTSCLFPDLIDVFVSEGDDGFFISVSFQSDISSCLEDQDGTFTCLYAGEGGASITSNVVLTGADIAFLLLLDPMVLQLPSGASAVTGSYAHTGSGSGGPLTIQTGLASVPADVNRSFVAEPGTQLVVVELPSGAPTTGNFAFNLNFMMPPSATAVPIKALFTGRVDDSGQTYYSPLLPCTTDLGSVPEMVVSLPGGGLVPVPLGQVQGCNGEVYVFGGGVGAVVIPTLGSLGLLVLAVLLLVATGTLLRRSRQP